MNEEDIARLVSRVDELEKKQRLSRFMIASAWAAAFFSLFTTTMPVVLTRSQVLLPVLRTRNLEIVNEYGKVVVDIRNGLGRNDGGSIHIADANGQERCNWSANPKGAELMMVANQTDHAYRAGLSVRDTLSANLVLSGDDDSQARLGISNNRPSIQLFGQNLSRPLFRAPQNRETPEGR